MEDLLTDLLANSSLPVISAILLGLLTAISPCPLATNITAIGFISKDVENKRRVFINGLVYTAGRMISYTILAAVIVFGADQFKISNVFQQYGEKIIGPLMVLIGLFMLDVLKINFPGFGNLTKRFENSTRHNSIDALLLGLLFALAFCPYSGVLYFGMLMPLTIESSSGLLLPLLYALATGIPVIIFAWLISFAFSGVSKVYNGLKNFEIWFRRVVSILFIGVGLYYIIVIYF